MSFETYKLSGEVLEGISCLGFKDPTPIQHQAIPAILEGRDVIGCAQTGTGKTGAFLIPVMDRIIREKNDNRINTLIIVPTRELASQIDQQAEGIGYFAGLSTFPIYGGGSGAAFDQERQALTQGADIVIATPGRLIMHLNQNYVDFSGLKHLILDEADRMLDMGFFEDIMRIIARTPQNRQTLLFSATMPPKIRKLADAILKNPVEITIAVSRPAEKIEQLAYMVYEKQKPSLVREIMSDKQPESSIIFASSRAKVKEIVKELKGVGLPVKAISSDLEQNEREEVLSDFRNKKLKILAATDVLSRGIDIEGIDLVLNYDVPHEAEDYIHRIGRTARASATGLAITFITPEDQHRFARIERMLESEIPKGKVPEDLGAVPEYAPSAKKKKKSKKKSGGKFQNTAKGNAGNKHFKKKRFFKRPKNNGNNEHGEKSS